MAFEAEKTGRVKSTTKIGIPVHVDDTRIWRSFDILQNCLLQHEPDIWRTCRGDKSHSKFKRNLDESIQARPPNKFKFEM